MKKKKIHQMSWTVIYEYIYKKSGIGMILYVNKSE